MSIELAGAVACVTGGARGIGKETARALAARGAHVWIGDLDLALAQETARELGPTVWAHHLDVTDPESFEQFLRAPGRPVGMLVNNAGVMHTGAFTEIDLASHLREIAIDLSGVVIGMRLALPGMLERNEGHIVNVASMAGKLTFPGIATYNAAKFGVVALSRSVRSEIEDSRVTISTVMPAAVRTELLSGLSTHGAPTSDPRTVAKVIVDSARNGRREIAVPGWAHQLGQVQQLLPEAGAEALKRLVGGNRLLHADTDKRRAYDARS